MSCYPVVTGTDRKMSSSQRWTTSEKDRTLTAEYVCVGQKHLQRNKKKETKVTGNKKKEKKLQENLKEI